MFWAEAINTAAYLVNLSPCSAIDYKTPFEKWHKQNADYTRLRVFGCDAFAHVPKESRTKLDPRATKCIFLGYQRDVKGYRLWDPLSCKLVVSRDVSFNESRSSKEGENGPTTNKGPHEPSIENEGELVHDSSTRGQQGEAPHADLEQDNVPRDVEEEEQVIADEPPLLESAPIEEGESSTGRPIRIRHAPDRYGTWFPTEHAVRDEDLLTDDLGHALITEDGSPSSYVESQAAPEKLKWNAAMRQEMKSLGDNKTWELVELPNGRKAIDCKWIYRMKDGPTDDAEKIFKARLVAKGFEQRKGIDYSEVFSPVAKYSTICLLCALVSLFGLILDQMDVVTAFLYGSLEEEIYMRQPEGFTRKGKERCVCRLLKSLYGLKQSPRQWNKRFDVFMHAQDFIRSSYDPCVYMKKVDNTAFGFIVLVLYVDDMLIAAKDKSEIVKLKA